MKPFIETRMFTITEQIATVQPNETNDGLVLVTSEIDESTADSRLYLTFEEGVELSKLLLATIDRLKK